MSTIKKKSEDQGKSEGFTIPSTTRDRTSTIQTNKFKSKLTSKVSQSFNQQQMEKMQSENPLPETKN